MPGDAVKWDDKDRGMQVYIVDVLIGQSWGENDDLPITVCLDWSSGKKKTKYSVNKILVLTLVSYLVIRLGNIDTFNVYILVTLKAIVGFTV